jgi:hypothetical protein
MPGKRVHPRRDIIEQVIARLEDLAEKSPILLRGRPGSGKSTALAGLIAAVDSRSNLRLGYAALRNGDPNEALGSDFSQPGVEPSGRDASENKIVRALTIAAVQGMPEIAAVMGTTIKVAVQTGPVIESQVDVARNWIINLPPGPYTVDLLEVVLEARAQKLAAGVEGPTVVAVIDGLDELAIAAPRALRAIEQLCRVADNLARGGVRIVLSAHHVPSWFSGIMIDVEATAAGEILKYAEAELGVLAEAGEGGPRVDGQLVSDLADAIARRADGLFIIAAGYLAEIGRGTVPGDIWERRPLRSAVAYFEGALARLRDPVNWPEYTHSRLVRDTERFLAILATSRVPVTDAQIDRIWRLEELPINHSPEWTESVKDNVLRGPAGSYITSTDNRTAHALFHPTVGEAVDSGNATCGRSHRFSPPGCPGARSAEGYCEKPPSFSPGLLTGSRRRTRPPPRRVNGCSIAPPWWRPGNGWSAASSGAIPARRCRSVLRRCSPGSSGLRV